MKQNAHNAFMSILVDSARVTRVRVGSHQADVVLRPQ